MRAFGWDSETSARSTNALLTYRKCCLLTPIMLVFCQWQWELFKVLCCRGFYAFLHNFILCLIFFLTYASLWSCCSYKHLLLNKHSNFYMSQITGWNIIQPWFQWLNSIKMLDLVSLGSTSFGLFLLDLLVWSVCTFYLDLRSISEGSLESSCLEGLTATTAGNEQTLKAWKMFRHTKTFGRKLLPLSYWNWV